MSTITLNTAVPIEVAACITTRGFEHQYEFWQSLSALAETMSDADFVCTIDAASDDVKKYESPDHRGVFSIPASVANRYLDTLRVGGSSQAFHEARAVVDKLMTELNPSKDSQDTHVIFVASGVTSHQQGQLTEALLDAGIPHKWDSSHLSVERQYEGITEQVLADTSSRMKGDPSPSHGAGATRTKGTPGFIDLAHPNVQLLNAFRRVDEGLTGAGVDRVVLVVHPFSVALNPSSLIDSSVSPTSEVQPVLERLVLSAAHDFGLHHEWVSELATLFPPEVDNWWRYSPIYSMLGDTLYLFSAPTRYMLILSAIDFSGYESPTSVPTGVCTVIEALALKGGIRTVEQLEGLSPELPSMIHDLPADMKKKLGDLLRYRWT